MSSFGNKLKQATCNGWTKVRKLGEGSTGVVELMEKYDEQYPIEELDPMYDMYYYDQDQNGYGYDDQLEDD